MKLQKKELIMIASLGLLIYIFVFYKFIYVASIPEINEKSMLLETKKIELAKLENDLANINVLKSKLKSKEFNNTRMSQYVMNDSNVSDSIEYIDKFSILLNKKLSSITVSEPTKVDNIQEGSPEYYKSEMAFTLKIPYQELIDVLKYLEGGSRLVTVDKLEVVQLDEDSDQKPTTVQTISIYRMSFGISFYSLKAENLEKFYEYSRYKFLTNEDSNLPTDNFSNQLGNTVNRPISKPLQPAISSLTDNVLRINIDGIMVAGKNFDIWGFNQKDIMGFRSNNKHTLNVFIENNTYKLSVVDDQGKSINVSNVLKNIPIKIEIASAIVDIPANKNVGLNVKITNNSGKNLQVTISDPYKTKKINILDRIGNVINMFSREENVSIS